MGTRGTELRRRDRRVILWSLAIAAVVHAAVFLLWPTMQIEPLAVEETLVEAGGEIVGIMVAVDVTFGPPMIFEADGSVTLEPPDRVLQADRILGLPTECEALLERDRTPAQGLVRLQVVASGHTIVGGLEESTGDECADEVILTVANDLLYRWIPSDRFPAPVDLLQPVTLTEAWG